MRKILLGLAATAVIAVSISAAHAQDAAPVHHKVVHHKVVHHRHHRHHVVPVHPR